MDGININTVTLTNCYFSTNTAGDRGGAVAIFVPSDQFGTGRIVFGNTTFINNTASVGSGGAVYFGGRYTTFKVPT